MPIKDLFQNDIYRTINGVVYADKLDGDIVWQELDEYVVTQELIKHINQLFSVYGDSLNKADSSGKMGVWISGFFGSGKSHFLKILSYLFENKPVTFQGQTKTALEFFRDKIPDAMSFSAIQKAVATPTDVILFNIDSLSVQNDEAAATLKAFFSVFNRKRGFCSNYAHIAHVESFLTKKGVYKEFRAAFEERSGSSWYKEREDYVFYTDDLIKSIVAVLPNQAENTELLEWIENGEKKYPLTIENFATLVAEYVEEKGRRLLFLADEMGQFVGSQSDRMLNLQTIVENLGTKAKGKVWVFVTSQEDIDSVLGMKIQSKSNDFSKIQARFHTRLSLSSSSIAEVIQKRLLRKKDTEVPALTATYHSKRDILLNQSSFTTDTPTMPSFKSESEFVASYPFVPYQFNLVQDIFDAVRQVGATGLNLSKGERSMLDAFQTALKIIGEKKDGSLVPLYAFFPTIQSFLDSSVAKTLYNAHDIETLIEFDHRLLETLFLIRYLKLRRIKGNVQNLSVLCLPEVDADMVSLKKGVEESLARLERENLINIQNDEFVFLTIEEQSITREIQNTQLQANEDIRELAAMLFRDEFEGKNKYKHGNGKVFDLQLIGDGFNYTAKGDLQVEVVSPFSGQGYGNKKTNAIMTSAAGNQILVILPEVPDFYRDLNLFLKTKQFLTDKGGRTLSPGEETIIAQKSNENIARRKRLVIELKKVLGDSHVFISGSEFHPSASAGSQFLMDCCEYLVKALFTKLDILQEPVGDWEAMLRNLFGTNGAVLLGGTVQTKNAKALNEIRQFLELSHSVGRTPVVLDVVKKYAQVPYGWSDGNVQVLLGFLHRLSEIKLVYSGNYVESKDVPDRLLKSSQYDLIQIQRTEVVDNAIIVAAEKLAKEMFNDYPPSGMQELATHIKENLRTWQSDLSQYLKLVEHEPSAYPAVADIQTLLKTIKSVLLLSQDDEFLKDVVAKVDVWKENAKSYRQIEGFYSAQITSWRSARALHTQLFPNVHFLGSDPEFVTDFQTLSDILGNPSPYAVVKDLAPISQRLLAVEAKAVAGLRVAVIDKVNSLRDQLTPDCQELNLSPDDTYKVKSKLTHLEKQTAAEKNLAQLTLMAGKLADDAYSAGVDVLLELRKAALPKPAAGAPPPKSVSYTPYKIIDHLVTKEIETTAEVDHLVEVLRTELKKQLSQGKKIRLE